MFEKEIILDKSDPHFVEIVDKSGCLTELKDSYLCNCADAKPPEIIIKLPEVRGLLYPRLQIHFKVTSGSWYLIEVDKSKDGSKWTSIFREVSISGDRPTDIVHEVLLVNTCEFYKIRFKDGRYPGEKIWLYKKAILKGFTPEEMIGQVFEINPLLIIGALSATFAIGFLVGRYFEV